MSQNVSSNKKTLRYQLATFGFAFNGLKAFFRTEMKSWIHLSFAFIVIIAGILFEISGSEWAALIFAIGLVFIAEIYNTAIESIVDQLVPEKKQWAGLVKDFSAAGVLVASIVALTIGILVFLPEIIQLL